MPSTCSDGRRARVAVASLLAAACSYVPPPSCPRPALPVRVEPREVPVAALVERNDLGEGGLAGVLEASGERVRFRLHRGDPAVARPLVLIVPILAGGADLLDGIAQQMLRRGFDVAACDRVDSAMRPPQRTRDLDELFRRTVLHQRILLRWLAATVDPGPAGTFVLGISMGGMIAAVVAATEPGVDGVAVCLAGGDLAGMVLCSSEPRVQRWLAWRRAEDGIGDGQIAWEMRQFLRHEPLRFAAGVATEKVLFVSAAFDSVVPQRHQDLLWEALGRPARLCVPMGHYSAVVAIDPILTATAEHFRGLAPGAP